MPTNTETLRISRLRLLSRLAGITVSSVSLAVLVGWLLNIGVLKSPVHGLASMKANTALGMLGAGLALWLTVVDPPNKTARIAAILLALFIIVLGILTASEYFWSVDFHIDQLLVSDPEASKTPYPGRMSPITACVFVLNGLALLLFGWVSRWSQGLSLISLTAAIFALLGYAFDVRAMYGFGPYTPITIDAAICFVLLSLGILAAESPLGLTEVIVSDSAGGTMARMLGPSLPIALFVLGVLRFAGEVAGYYDSHFGVALMVMSSIVVVSGLTLWMAAKLHKVDFERQQAFDQTLALDEELRASAEALTMSEKLARLVVDSAVEAMVMVNHEGQIVLVNVQTEKLFGYHREDLLGQPVEILVPESSRGRHPALRGDFFARPQARPMGAGRDLHARRKDGTQVPVEIGLNPIETPEGVWVLSSIVDITDRKRAEATLRESEGRFRNMADTAPVLIWVSSPDKLCIFFNKVWLEFTGRTMAQELGNGWTEGVHPDDLDHCIATYSASFDAHRRFRMEYRLRRADGEYRWILDDGAPRFTPSGIFAGYIGSCVDITDRRRAEEERQKFVSLADSSLEFVGMCDLEFRPFYVNPAGIRLVGLDNLEAACRIKVQDYFFPEDQPFLNNEFFPQVQHDGHGKAEIRFRHFKTGEPIWILYNVFRICDTRGDTVAWATVSVNITERRRTERELQESRQELRALAGRLINAEEEERKRISRELHDDLSQKLALLAFDTGSLVLAPPPSLDEMKEHLRNLQTRVGQLSQDVRRIAHRLHPSILEDLGLTPALRELCEEFSAREEIEVVFEHEAMPEALPVDIASCLYRVAQEALHNVSKHARASQVRLKVSRSPEGIHLCIHDTGVGFDSEGGRRRHGLGFLSMKERVGLVQGEFSIDSQPGRGTEIRVFVPLSKEIG